jgi:hypothetical protein
MGILGATDIVLYHSISHGIRHHVDSRWELVTHSLRGPTYASLFILVPNFAMQGTWFWVLLGILVIDVAISIADFSIEGSSRRLLGGLPAGEYVLHIVLAMLFGAFVGSVFYGSGHWESLPTRIAYSPADVRWVIRLVMGVMAVLVLVSALQDVWAVIRLFRKHHYVTGRAAEERVHV